MKKVLSWMLSVAMALSMATGVMFTQAEETLSMKKIMATDASVTMLAPSLLDDESRARIQHNDAPAGAGGMKITFDSNSDGYKKVNVHYDHAHKTGKAIDMMLFYNMDDSATEGGTAVQWNNNADGNWGRYQTATFVMPVKKGSNTLRIASAQSGAGWQIYVDYIELSEGTYATMDDIPRAYIDAPRPKDIWDTIQAEILINNDMAVISDTEDGGKSVTMSGNEPFYYSELDFGNGEVKSVELRYQGTGTWPYVEFRLDSADGEIIAEGSMPSPYDKDWATTKINLTKEVTGSHKLYICYVKGNAALDWFKFSKDIVPDYVPSNPMNVRDNHADTWVATDDLGRQTPTSTDVGAVRKDKYVGMFYFLWHQNVNGELYDHYAAYVEGGLDKVWEVMAQGPRGYGHYWAEPYLGYYRTEDEWVIRKHAQQLVNAGVDFIFFDTSNSSIYSSSVKKILEVYKQIRDEGGMTPQVVFFMGSNENLAPKKIADMYYDFYKDGKYSDLWFQWDGKPLFLGPIASLEAAGIADQFTVRASWAFNGWTGDGIGKWPWIADYPQRPGKDYNGNIEQVTVACGFHATTSKGRSFHEGKQPTDGKKDFEFELESTPMGLAFEEQWKTVYDLDPKVVMLTGWNEWWAGRWENSGEKVANTYISSSDPSDANTIRFPHHYVDCFNPEFSRDLEAMKGGFKDNYYYQTVQNIRKHKGVTPIPASYGNKAIAMDGGFEQWSTVGPEYRDTLYDTTHRNCPANQGPEVYVNETGRNDIDLAKVSIDGNDIAFYVKCRDAITAPEGQNWMNLFIDADQNTSTGWYGYDYIINRSQNGNTVSVEKHTGEGWNWETVGSGEYRVSGNEMHIKLAADLIGLSGKTDFDFKWADNSTTTGDIMEFIDLGDAAPDERFNFRYTQKDSTELSSELRTLLDGGAIAMKVYRPRALVGTEFSFVDPDNGYVAPTISNDRTVVPVRFVSEKFGAQVSWDPDARLVTIEKDGTTIKLVIDKAEIDINGTVSPLEAPAQIINDRTFIPLRAMTEAIGKKVVWDNRGLILIGEQSMTESPAILDELENLLN